MAPFESGIDAQATPTTASIVAVTPAASTSRRLGFDFHRSFMVPLSSHAEKGS
jgi:hypothetical protein